MRKIDKKIEATIMVIREELMSYFKGTCIDRIPVGTAVTVRELGESEGGYFFERRERDLAQARVIGIGYSPILKVRHNPEQVEFITPVLKRSPQLKLVQKELEKFLKTYLSGIERKYNADNK